VRYTEVAPDRSKSFLANAREPGIDGLDATRRIRALAGIASRTPIIGTSKDASNTGLDDLGQALERRVSLCRLATCRSGELLAAGPRHHLAKRPPGGAVEILQLHLLAQFHGRRSANHSANTALKSDGQKLLNLRLNIFRYCFTTYSFFNLSLAQT